MHSRPSRVLGLLVATLFVASACGGNTATPGAPTSAATAGPPATTGPTAAPAQTFGIPAFDAAALRWYCCLGTGEDPAQQPTEKKVAADFATKYPGSSLKFEATTYDDAATVLKTQIRGDNSPDIVGPVGVGGLASFAGQWVDLAPFIASSHYDLAQYPQNLVDFNKTADGQIGVPFAVYPSVLWYNADMFEEIGLKPPPHKYNEQYEMPDGTMVDWNYDTIRQIAMLLTVDKNNNDATEADFDPTKIVQYGFEPQRDDLRALGSYFGPGNLAAADGKTVAIPDSWKAAWKYLYAGTWTDHFIMSSQVFNSPAIASGDQAFFSDKVAMSANFLWITYGVTGAGDDWDLAALPSYNGTVTAPLNADTFAILKGSKNQQAAFAALAYMLDDQASTLLPLYGGMPARTSEQDAFLEQLAQTEDFPAEVDWQVAKDSLGFADVPNFEAPMPKYNETLIILRKYLSKWTTTAKLDIDAEIGKLQAEVQAEWDK